LTEQQKLEVIELLEEFQEVFTNVPGLTTLGEHAIHVTTDEPVYSKPYPLSHAMQAEVEEEFDSMLKLGVIEPSTLPYASPIVIVRKRRIIIINDARYLLSRVRTVHCNHSS